MYTIVFSESSEPSSLITRCIKDGKLLTVPKDQIDTPFFSDSLHEVPDLFIIESLRAVSASCDVKIIQSLREHHGLTPIIFITERQVDSLYVEALLDAGADTCIKGDFLPEEFLVRVKKLVEKKDHLLFKGTEIHMHDTAIDIKKHSVLVSGKRANLTRTEYGLLFHLCMHKNSVVKSNELHGCLRGGKVAHSEYLVNIHMHNLRRKLKGGYWIKTVPHYGFIALG